MLKNLTVGDEVLYLTFGQWERAAKATVEAVHAGNGNLKVKGAWFRTHSGFKAGDSGFRLSSPQIAPCTEENLAYARERVRAKNARVRAEQAMGALQKMGLEERGALFEKLGMYEALGL